MKRYLVEGSDCSISQGCFGGTAEELQHCNKHDLQSSNLYDYIRFLLIIQMFAF